ncbi:hypothetical protein [Prosthecobacter sp.]|uniref:hypothetical protein n=1 Tax=Prosthecobacter sp. TaxID=1965333 RepID=UPI0037833491
MSAILATAAVAVTKLQSVHAIMKWRSVETAFEMRGVAGAPREQLLWREALDPLLLGVLLVVACVLTYKRSIAGPVMAMVALGCSMLSVVGRGPAMMLSVYFVLMVLAFVLNAGAYGHLRRRKGG